MGLLCWADTVQEVQLTKLKIINLIRNMMPKSISLLAKILQLLKPTIDEANFMRLEFLIRHLLQLLRETDQESINAFVEVLAVLLALDQHPQAIDGTHHQRARSDDIPKLLLRAQLVKARFVHHLRR